MTGIGVTLIGFAAQGLFSARMLVQWILSERARRVLSPTLFWVLSVIASILLCLYGWLRSDFAIILGQLFSYYIYLWNLRIKGALAKVPVWIRMMLCIIPIALAIPVADDAPAVCNRFFANPDIPFWLLLYGSAGQIIFTLRFIYQWYYSVRRHRSVLPAGFWIISLIGSLTICSYAIFRADPVLIVGQSVGLAAYTRNLIIGRRERRNTLQDQSPMHG